MRLQYSYNDLMTKQKLFCRQTFFSLLNSSIACCCKHVNNSYFQKKISNIIVKLVLCLAGVNEKKTNFIQKKRKAKNKMKCRMFMHVLVNKMLIIKFNAVIIGKFLLDAHSFIRCI